ncbi:MAG: Response regulator protein VraR [Chroococcopsis gigantea SAG 12.99]|jgi:two-component system vancomycin resistance associated response regulator VraR|nr:Response regulator protein VraR [Chroococcopsis gigantea SAG 12.99]
MVLTQGDSKIRVLIVDDHELTRLGLQVLISKEKNLEVVDVAANGKEGLEKVEKYRPDVVILDLQMPILDGLSAATKIKQLAPQTKIIAYTSVDDPQIEVMSQTAPIDNFCPKDITSQDLIALIRSHGKAINIDRVSN